MVLLRWDVCFNDTLKYYGQLSAKILWLHDFCSRKLNVFLLNRISVSVGITETDTETETETEYSAETETETLFGLSLINNKIFQGTNILNQ